MGRAERVAGQTIDYRQSYSDGAIVEAEPLVPFIKYDPEDANRRRSWKPVCERRIWRQRRLEGQREPGFDEGDREAGNGRKGDCPGPPEGPRREREGQDGDNSAGEPESRKTKQPGVQKTSG